MKETSIYSLVF